MVGAGHDVVAENGIEVAAIGNGRPEALAALLRKAGEILEARIAARDFSSEQVLTNATVTV